MVHGFGAFGQWASYLSGGAFAGRSVVMAGTIQGSCLCRGVAWEVVGPLDMMTHCHCSMCRKHHGAAFVTFASASADGFRWHSGEDLIQGYESSPGNLRPFCSRCGSKVPGEPRGDRFFTTAGNLDGDPGGRPAAHIYVSSKAPWHEIHDDVPQFDTMPPGFDVPDLPRRPFDTQHGSDPSRLKHIEHTRVELRKSRSAAASSAASRSSTRSRW